MSQPFVLFSLLIIAKLALVWGVVFEPQGGSLWNTLVTGIPPTWVFFCLVEWLLPRRKLSGYMIVDLLFTSVYFAAIMYYKYFGVIVTYHELRQVNQVTEVKSSMFSLMDPYFLFIFADILAFWGLLIWNRKVRAWGRRLAVPQHRRMHAAGAGAALVVCVAIIFPFRYGMNELKQAEDMGIANFEAYAVFAPSKDAEVDTEDIAQTAINQLKGITETASPQLQGAAAGKNVIVIQLEAFQNFLLGLKLDGREITPNLNKLMNASFYFPHFFQQVGQGNTADAEYVVNTSLYVPPNGAASEVYADKQLPGMPKTLAANGYQTATFHTNNVTFWNRDELYKALGWEKYFDDTFFGDSDPVAFAASDEVLYAKTADELAALQQKGPFYAQVISMSGHHPFNIPPSKYKMDLPKRYEGTLVGDYIQAQNYADFALGQFIAKLKLNGVWDRSVVVIYGDHQGLPIYSLDAREKGLMAEIYGREYGVTDMMNIPLIISVPGMEPQLFLQLGGQSDIFPTVANLLGVSLKDEIHMGQDLLNQPVNLLPERYYLPTGSLITSTGAFVPGEGYEDGTTYLLTGGQTSVPAATEDEYERMRKLLSISDRYVSSLPERN